MSDRFALPPATLIINSRTEARRLEVFLGNYGYRWKHGISFEDEPIDPHLQIRIGTDGFVSCAWNYAYIAKYPEISWANWLCSANDYMERINANRVLFDVSVLDSLL